MTLPLHGAPARVDERFVALIHRVHAPHAAALALFRGDRAAALRQG